VGMRICSEVLQCTGYFVANYFNDLRSYKLTMTDEVENGTTRDIAGKSCVFYDGYWIRSYHLHKDSFADKKQMIDQLTRRVFHHVEQGINTPSKRLDEIREVYEAEDDPARKRVKGAMLAGSLLNRGRQILTAIVELEEAGVKIETSNELLRECGRCFIEALSLGKNIKLADGGEGVDELWGEPFKVFSLPIEDFFQSRYIKISQTMSDIDQITSAISTVTIGDGAFSDVNNKLLELGVMAKMACETIRTDPAMFDVWPRYIATKEEYEHSLNSLLHDKNDKKNIQFMYAYRLIKEGGVLLIKLATLRVPIPDSVRSFTTRCKEFTEKS
jgi:hypothetical protein